MIYSAIYAPKFDFLRDFGTKWTELNDTFIMRHSPRNIAFETQKHQLQAKKSWES